MGGSAFLIEGVIIAAVVILDGIYVVMCPPYGDEAQGYGIMLIGVFILLATFELHRRAWQENG